MTSFLGCIFALIIDCFIRHCLLGFLLNGVIMCFTFCDLSITFFKIMLFSLWCHCRWPPQAVHFVLLLYDAKYRTCEEAGHQWYAGTWRLCFSLSFLVGKTCTEITFGCFSNFLTKHGNFLSSAYVVYRRAVIVIFVDVLSHFFTPTSAFTALTFDFYVKTGFDILSSLVPSLSSFHLCGSGTAA